ncbi:hypothetical protein [Streptomyces chrestomyceticus]|uniref:hypothetical protein n=1 Tax=Streptomyces chrestomyceticus TaxID=68185 RepID=UPI0033E246D9
MKRHCPDCLALRAEARQPGADLGDLLIRVVLHEAAQHPQRRTTARRTVRR